MNMIHISHSGNNDNMRDNPRSGTINPTMLCFFKTFKVWITKCDLVRPINAIGFILNPFKYIDLKRFGMFEYRNNPASPVRLIKTLPVFLNLVTNSVAVSRCFMLRTWERIDAVRGIDHLFFLKG